MPKKYIKEVETILGNKANFEKFQKALKAENVDTSIKELPDSINEGAVTGLVDFIGKHDQDEIIKVLNNDLDKMTTEIDKMRSEQKAKKIIKKEKNYQQAVVQKKPRAIMDDSHGKTTEERFRDLIREVHDRVHKIELKQDDWKTYSEVQQEIDNFLDEATTEILAIKNGLKRRFENINSGRYE